MKLRKIKPIGKKGNASDLIYLPVALFVIAFVSVLAYQIYSEYTDRASGHFDNPQQTNIETYTTTVLTEFDYLFMIILVFSIMATVISAFYLDTHPIMFFVSLIFLAVSGIIQMAMSNVYQTFEAQSSVSSSAAEFSIISLIMNHYPAIFIMGGVIVLIALFTKFRGFGTTE